MALASVSTLSGSVVMGIERGGAYPQPVVDCLRLLFTKGTQWVRGGVRELLDGLFLVLFGKHNCRCCCCLGIAPRAKMLKISARIAQE